MTKNAAFDPQKVKKFFHLPVANLLRVHTMPKFITHDGLAEGLLNHGHCTATGFLVPWKTHLTNSHALLNVMILRMETDWIAMAPKMRKAWNLKDLESWLTFKHSLPLLMIFGFSWDAP